MGVALMVTPVQADDKGPLLKTLEFIIKAHDLGVTIKNTDVKYQTQQAVIRTIQNYGQQKRLENIEKKSEKTG